ncbi:STAS domain-containing protein [Bacillus sp. CECT 9360]|uniref:STAS domain-containing protein n=1 Tax=Bacillus sp. CECT 9360 TaxID=2845821 RepID=UPI001E53A64D|nr:STAS domain-containing protein [Bacillus sp. CECT 9360]CAH0346425.1 hypothetical protein BCI9360_02759 [Bacillus sp. CECT 9360]
MSLIVEKETQGSTIILKVTGYLDISTTNVIQPYLEISDEIDTLIFDFSNLEFIDSTGIGTIIEAIYLSQEGKFNIQFHGLNEATYEIFETVGLFNILEAVQGEVN